MDTKRTCICARLWRWVRLQILSAKVGYRHAEWGYGFMETYRHLRRPRSFPLGCLFCVSKSEYEEAIR